MLFHTWTFVVFFLVVYAGYWLLRPTRYWLPWLGVASNVFYGWWNPLFPLLLLYSTLVDFGAAWLIERSRRHKLWLVVGLANNLLLLGFFKYAGVLPPISRTDIADGLTLFVVGLFKKLAIANYLAQYVDPIYASPERHNGAALATATFADRVDRDVLSIQAGCNHARSPPSSVQARPNAVPISDRNGRSVAPRRLPNA